VLDQAGDVVFILDDEHAGGCHSASVAVRRCTGVTGVLIAG
jgi:hypothetical protein